MIKRANKLTSLFLAAAAVISLVPATGINASDRLGTKEGTIEQAIAFKDGRYIYRGYKTDDDDTSIYYNAGSKDKPLEDLDNAVIKAKYGEKYAYVSDSNPYLIDLSNGKVIDDETPEDKADNANSKLRNTLKKTDRYGKIDSVNLDENSIISQNQFGEVWYKYSAKPLTDADGVSDANSNDGNLYGFANQSGKYVDVSTLANIYAYSSSKNKVVRVEKFNKENKDAKLRVDLVGSPEVLTQDRDYIYAKIKVNVTDTSEKSAIDLNKAEADAKVKVDAAQANVNRFTNTASTEKAAVDAAQKAVNTNKAKLENVLNADGTVKTKGLNTLLEEAKTAAGTKTDAADVDVIALKAAQKAVDDNKAETVKLEAELVKANTALETKLGIFANELKNANAELEAAKKELADVQAQKGQNGSITSVAKTIQRTYIQKISKSQGEKEHDAYLPKNVTSYEIATDGANGYDSDDANDAYKVLVNSEDDGFKLEDNKYSVKDNTLYVTRVKDDSVKVFKIKLRKSKIKGIDANGKMTEDKLDVYLAERDGDSDQDIKAKEGVSIDVDGNTWCINQGKIYKFNGTDKKEMYTCDRSINALEVYDENSLVAYEKDGDVYTTVQEGSHVTEGEATPAQTGWINTNLGWTFFDGAGVQVKNNWVNSGGNYYYVNNAGIMESNKWVNPFGKWYLLKQDGSMASSGWVCPYGNWYYLDSNGSPLTGWQYLNGSWYYMTSEGTMQTGWKCINGSWYYLQSSGAMKTGWLNDNGTWYFLNSSGSMLSNTTMDGYRLGANGAWTR